jgi:hypothetical protein
MLAQFDALQALFSIRRPACVLVVEGNSPGDEVTNQAAQAAGIPIVCLQQGWSPIVHVGFRNMSYSEMLVWGQGFADILRPYNPNQSFVVTGSHTLNSGAPSPPDWLRSRASRKRVVTFLLQAPRDMIGPRRWREFLNLAAAAAQRWPDGLILVREHPQYQLGAVDLADLGRAPNLCIIRPAQCGLAETLAVSTVSVSIYSTTILESIAAGVPPVIYNCTSMPRFSPDVDSLGAGVEVHDFETALLQIDRILNDHCWYDRLHAEMEKFRERYFHGDDGRSCSRIVSRLEAFIATGAS